MPPHGDLDGFLEPESVAVIGATPREGSVGRAICNNLEEHFSGEIHYVNPNYDEVLGRVCVDSMDEVSGDISLGVIVVPAKSVLDVLENLGEKGVDDVVVISAGFSETGSGGADLERGLVDTAERLGIDVVGPNSLGVISTSVGLNATFAPTHPLDGSIGFLSQSGAFITAALDWAVDEGIGFNYVVSLGNKSVIGETEFIEAWGEDEGTNVIMGYLEGIDNGGDFIESVRRVSKDTPVVLIKSGRTEAGARAVSSHTGSLAGSDKAYRAGLDKAGVIRASNAEELFDYAEILDSQPLPKEPSVGIVTNSGGPGVMATDEVGESRLSLASFNHETIRELRDGLPEAAGVYNPVDVIGDADVERFMRGIQVVMRDSEVGMCVVIACPTAVMDFEDLADALIDEFRDGEIPIAVSLMGGMRARNAASKLRRNGIPCFFDPSRAVRALDVLEEYRVIREREPEEPREFDVDKERAAEVLDTARRRGVSLLGVEALELLEAYGVPVVSGEIAGDAEEAEEIASGLDSDVVLKIVSPDIVHKTDIGGVKTGVSTREVRDAYEEIKARAMSYQPDADILGVLVQEMVDLDNAVETVVGMNRDPQFGPLLMFGLGGIYVEVMKDTSFRVAPVSPDEALDMVDEVKASELLRGTRGQPRMDIESTVEVIERIGALVSDFPGILEMDINPLVVKEDGVYAIDLRLTVDEERL